MVLTRKQKKILQMDKKKRKKRDSLQTPKKERWAKFLGQLERTRDTNTNNTTNIVPNELPLIADGSNKNTPTSSTSKNIGNSTACKPSTVNTIVIDDSDEENEGANSNSNHLFYLDRNPGVREDEVPLYNTCGITGMLRDQDVDNAQDHSLIVLDSTAELSRTFDMENTQTSIEHLIEPSSIPTKLPTRTEPMNVIAIELVENIGHSSSNISAPTEKDSNISLVEHVLDVIDLSDYSDTECTTSTAMDCIPLGYDIMKSAGKKCAKNKAKTVRSNKNFAEGKTPELKTARTKPKKRMVVIDGNNVAFGHLNGKMFSVKGLQLCVNYFKKLGHEVVAVVPQYKLKKHQSTDYKTLDKMHRDGDVILAPSKNLPGQCSSTYDDRLILSVAAQFDAVIISNDNFRDLIDVSEAWRYIIQTQVVGYTWVKDCFFLPDDPYGRHGPSLQQLLNGNSS